MTLMGGIISVTFHPNGSHELAGPAHLSYMDDQGYRELGEGGFPSKTGISIGWSREWDQLPVIRRFAFAPHVNPRDDKMPVELIGPVDAPGGNGPSNGMYALQKALRKRIAEGLDWLSIKSLPASKGALPWFWHWDDRRYAAWWDAEGQPFVQGPNMLFTNSGSPRIDREECALLDASNCRAMFCHSEWYAELISKHRGQTKIEPNGTGLWVDRLPPGRECVDSDEDEVALAVYLDAIHQAQSFDRAEVRSRAAEQFATGRIVDQLLAGLEEQRSVTLALQTGAK